MQLLTRIQRAGWTDAAVWSSVVTGLALSSWALAEKSWQKVRSAMSRQPDESSTEAWGEPGGEWQRLADDVEPDITRIEALVEIHARALDEIEAAEALIAECAALAQPSEAAASSQGHADPKPRTEPAASPLAA
jgi:hypothetical protein